MGVVTNRTHLYRPYFPFGTLPTPVETKTGGMGITRKSQYRSPENIIHRGQNQIRGFQSCSRQKVNMRPQRLVEVTGHEQFVSRISPLRVDRDGQVNGVGSGNLIAGSDLCLVRRCRFPGDFNEPGRNVYGSRHTPRLIHDLVDRHQPVQIERRVSRINDLSSRPLVDQPRYPVIATVKPDGALDLTRLKVEAGSRLIGS